MDYQSRNSRRIKAAFDRLRELEQRQGVKAIIEGTKEGYDRAIDIHKMAAHELHLTSGGDFGSMVTIDGQEVHSDIVTGPKGVSGDVEARMKDQIGLLAKRKRVVGIVMSEMKAGMHDVNWEKAVLVSSKKRAFAKAIAEMHNMKLK